MTVDEPDQSTMRTLLADDRTLLAWFRTAFGAYAVAIGVGGVLPKLAHSESVSYRLIGGAFSVLGVLAIALGLWQYISFQRVAHAPRLARLTIRATVAFGVAIGLLGVAITVLIWLAP